MTTVIVVVPPEAEEGDVHLGDGFHLRAEGMTLYTESGGYLVEPDELYRLVRLKQEVARAVQAS